MFFNVWDSGVVNIYGMHLRSTFRGKSDADGVGPSKFIFAFFLKFMRTNGFTAFRTAEINKPLFARLLLDAGFSPHNDDVVVELLPKTAKDSGVPIVKYFTDRIETITLPGGRVITGAATPRTHDDEGRYEFYKIKQQTTSLPEDIIDDRAA